MKTLRWIIVGGLGLVIVLGIVAVNRAAAPVAGGPSIRGSYVLESRDLPDGKQIKSPQVIGMMTFTADRRNFNVYWEQDGKPVSISTISHYTLSPTEFTEDSEYYTENGLSSQTPKYDATPAHGTSPVKITGDKIEIQLPLHSEPKVVFDANGMTATREGVFVDHWKKVE